jgi:hypothetical protein
MFFFAVLYQTLSKEKSLKPLRFQGFFEISTLGELGGTPCGFQTVLLAPSGEIPFIFNGYKPRLQKCTSK